jgi:hypothetical protein
VNDPLIALLAIAAIAVTLFVANRKYTRIHDRRSK